MFLADEATRSSMIGGEIGSSARRGLRAISSHGRDLGRGVRALTQAPLALMSLTYINNKNQKYTAISNT
jgi:hypothetical protein